MNRFSLAVTLVLAPLAAACTVGEGRGEVKGKLYVKNCEGRPSKPGADFGSRSEPRDFDLKVDFYAAEPIEDIKPNGSDNRVVVRLQPAGRRIEENDVLIFDIDAWRVAQCVRGVPTVLTTEALSRFCSFSIEKGHPRIRVGPGFPIRVNLALRRTCPGNPYVVGSARGIGPGTEMAPPEQWESWIELRAFGTAGERDGMTDVDPKFKVEFGERLYAERFALTIEDDRVLRAEARKEPAPEPSMMGAISGYFDFRLLRGQGAQTFP